MVQKKKQASVTTVGVRVSKPLKVRAKTYASANERDMREVLDEALDEYLKKRGA